MAMEAPQAAARKFALPKSLKQVALEEVRRRIFAREIPAGSRIEQVALAKELGMSRIPVREAISALVAEGLVELIPRRGAFVISLTKRDLIDHYWMLAQISARAAEGAAEFITEEELEQLERLADAVEAAQDEAERDRLNFEFHALINRAAHSPRLVTMFRTLGTPIPLRFYESHERFAAESQAEHRELIGLLRQHDVSGARSLMKLHMHKGIHETIAALEADGFWDD